MIDILLVSPRFSIEKVYGRIKRTYTVGMPLGLAYLAAYLLEKKVKVNIIDLQIEEVEELEDMLINEKPKIVGISSVTTNYLDALNIARIVKEIDKKVIVVLGGPHPSSLPEKCIENEYIDIVVKGEGEETLFELYEHINQKKRLTGIQGIYYKESGNIISNPPRQPIEDIDKIPYPARHLLKREKYDIPASLVFKKPVEYAFSSRGCPYKCIFCAGSKLLSKVNRRHSNERIIREIQHLIDEYGTKQISFFDDLFVRDRRETDELCNMIIDRGINKKIVWTCASRVDNVNPDILKKMHKAGCRYIMYGLETGSERLMKLIKKGITLEQVRNALTWTREARIKSGGSFILGLPTETYEESLQTIEFSKTLDLDWAQFTIATPYPGTELYEQVKNELGENWFEYNEMAADSNYKPSFIPAGRTEKELTFLQHKGVREFYYRPSQMLRVIRNIRNIHQIKIMGISLISHIGWIK
ncbi:MAG: B12-binding domain-containing radical SAM protein [Candidatus Altiarchaeota archaeon]|nr:B12-binding domain-containing radical SAM protein [Candidatus Altiarchaeota archaeon]